MKESETSPARLILIYSCGRRAPVLFSRGGRPRKTGISSRPPTNRLEPSACDLLRPESVIQMWRVQSEPRYWHQRLRQNAPASRAAADPEVRERDAHDDRTTTGTNTIEIEVRGSCTEIGACRSASAGPWG